MKESHLEPPFVWPDARSLAACPGPVPEIDTLIADSTLIFGVVHSVTPVRFIGLAKEKSATLPHERHRLFGGEVCE